MSFNNVAIVFVKGNDCRTRFRYITKAETINIMKNSDSKEKSGSLKKNIKISFFYLRIKDEQ